jgi:NADH:ubiquinone oxidoreductase subunit E
MTSETKNGQLCIEAVHKAVERHGTAREELIPILTDVNREVGYLPREALDEISRLMKVPKSQLFSVATFYHMLSTKPRGQHVIQFCESAPCHVVGGREVWQAVQNALQIKSGETTPDGKWSLETTSCLGICGVGPVLVIDEDIYGNVAASQVPEILARYSE